MNIISLFLEKVKDGICKITGTQETTCPECGKLMRSHGRCLRYVIFPYVGRLVFSLRVFFCRDCHRYHRELPDFIIPYKHHCVETYAEVYDKEPNELECEVDEKTIRRIRAWVTEFMKTGAATIQRLRLEHPSLKTNYAAVSTLGTLKYFVKAIANSNEWKFTSSPLLSG